MLVELIPVVAQRHPRGNEAQRGQPVVLSLLLPPLNGERYSFKPGTTENPQRETFSSPFEWLPELAARVGSQMA